MLMGFIDGSAGAYFSWPTLYTTYWLRQEFSFGVIAVGDVLLLVVVVVVVVVVVAGAALLYTVSQKSTLMQHTITSTLINQF